MAKEQPKSPKRATESSGGSGAGRRRAGRAAEASNERGAALEAAAEKLRQARQSFEEAQREYADALDEESLDFEQLRITLGEAVDATLQWVRKHPGAGVLAAAAAGFAAGRMTKWIG